MLDLKRKERRKNPHPYIWWSSQLWSDQILWILSYYVPEWQKTDGYYNSLGNGPALPKGQSVPTWIAKFYNALSFSWKVEVLKIHIKPVNWVYAWVILKVWASCYPKECFQEQLMWCGLANGNSVSHQTVS